MNIKNEVEKIAYEPNHWIALMKQSKNVEKLREQIKRNVHSQEDKIVSVNDLNRLLHLIYETKERSEYELEVTNRFVVIKTKEEIFVFRQHIKEGDTQELTQTKASTLFTLSNTNPFKHYSEKQGPKNLPSVPHMETKASCSISEVLDFYLVHYGKDLHQELKEMGRALTVPFCLSSALSSSAKSSISKVEIREQFVLIILKRGIAFHCFNLNQINVKVNEEFESRYGKDLEEKMVAYNVNK